MNVSREPNPTSQSGIPQTSTLATVAAIVAQVVGEDYAPASSIHMDTGFNRDLELESIEFVALAEMLQQEFGSQVDFVGWLATKELDEIIELRVGDLVEFIETCPS